MLLTLPTFICAAALSGCGGGGDGGSEDTVAAADTTVAAGELDAQGKRKIPTTTTPPPPTTEPAPTTPPTTTTPPPTTTDPATLPVFSDGTARLNAMLASGSNVAIPAGVYTINGELMVRNGQVIAPATGAVVILKAASGYTGKIITAVDISLTIRGITFDGNYANRLGLEGNNAANLINITGGTVVLEGNTFRYAPSSGVWAYRSAGMQLRGNTFLENYLPVRIDGNNVSSGLIENNTFKNTTAFRSLQHLMAVNTRDLVVRGNVMEGAGVFPASSHGYEGTWGNAIYIFNSTGYVVENNTVGRNYWSALVVGQNSTNATVRNNTLTGGTLGNGGLQAAWIEQVGANNITFTGNTLNGGLSVGDTGGDYLTITNNTIIVPPGGTGIDCNFAFKHGTISGNTIKALNATKPDMGIYLWQKDDPSTNIQLLNNAVSGFNKGIAANNLGSTGMVYGIHLSGNTFANNNVNVWVPSSVTLAQPLGQ